jgi:hypothetical protein
MTCFSLQGPVPSEPRLGGQNLLASSDAALNPLNDTEPLFRDGERRMVP